MKIPSRVILLLAMLCPLITVWGMDVPEGVNPLLWACEKGNTQEVAKLIAAHTDVNAADSNNSTALRYAAQQGHVEIVKALIEAGACVNRPNKLGTTPFLFACSHQAREIIARMLLTAGAAVDQQDSEGNTPLMQALHGGCTDIAHMLIKADANLDMQDKYGESALIRASVARGATMLQPLIDAGANLYLKDKYGETAAEVALRIKGNTAPLRLLIQAMKTSKLVGDIAHYRFPDPKLKATNPEAYFKLLHDLQAAMAQLKAYAQQQVIVNVVDQDGNRPLHCAILAGNRPMIVLILYYMFQAKRGESIMRRNNAGFTPVELAVVKSPTQLLPLLFTFATPDYK